MEGGRVPASKQTGERIDDLLAQGSEGDVRSELIRLGIRRIVEEALEAEVEDRLGRGYYRRADDEESRLQEERRLERLAVLLGLSLPTGDDADLQGTGTTGVQPTPRDKPQPKVPAGNWRTEKIPTGSRSDRNNCDVPAERS